MNSTISYNAFKKNDIRGIVGLDVSEELFMHVGKAYAQYIIKNTDTSENLWVSVARDARNHSPVLAKALIEGLIASGINVLDLGLCPTPLAYFSEFLNLKKENISSLAGTMIVTASHNPAEYNGIKMTFNGASFSEQEINELKELTKQSFNQEFEQREKGVYKEYNIIPDYINALSCVSHEMGKNLKIVVDSGNATGGIVAPELYRKFGCEVIDIFSEPDGNFPNHHPDPSKEENIKHLKEKVLEVGADFGIAFDGDSDRIGIVDDTGYSLPGDQLLLIFALDILKNLKVGSKKPVFISEVKCSQLLYDLIEQKGGRAIMWKTGHAFIKSKMREEKAILAGEMSGHTFFNDRYYGYDDAIYAGYRFIELVAKNKLKDSDFKISKLLQSLPKVFTSREVRFPCPDELKGKILDIIKEKIDQNPELFGSEIKKIITLDGIRVVFNSGFALIRASNTEPLFTLRFEADSQDNLDKYKNTMINLIEENLKCLQQ